MFLTFRACLQTSNHEADNELREIIEGNLQNAHALAAYGSRLAPADLIHQNYEEFLRIGIMKFLAHSALNRGYASKLEGSYVYSRDPEQGPAYHILKLIVEFTPTRASGHLPNPHRDRIAYERCVPQIFGSHAIDVRVQLNNAALRQRLQTDLRPVLEELEKEQIVT